MNTESLPVKKNRAALGEIYMVLASVLFATGGLALKFNDWNPLAVNGIRSFFGAIVIGLFILITRRKIQFNRTILFGAFAYVMMTTLFVVANRLTAAGNAIVLQFTCPVWIVIISWVLYHKKPGKNEILAMILIGAGILCFFMDSLKSGHLAGDITALISGFFYAVLFMINSMKGGDAFSSVFIGQIISFLLFAGFSFDCSWTVPNVLSIIWLGAVQVGLAYTFFSLATKITPPLQACLISGIEPVLNPALCAVFGFETMSPLSLLGAAIVIVSVIWYSLKGIH